MKESLNRTKLTLFHSPFSCTKLSLKKIWIKEYPNILSFHYDIIDGVRADINLVEIRKMCQLIENC